MSAIASNDPIWTVLGIAAEQLDDLERVRIATENRLRALTTEYGLDLGHPGVRAVSEMADRLAADEQQAVKNLEMVMKEHPLAEWCKSTPGVGMKQLARLLAATDDPYWNLLHDRPRSVSELWAFCGFHVLHPGDHGGSDTHGTGCAGVAPKHTKGQQGNWSDPARMRAYLIATSCIKARTSPYRAVYDAGREKYADSVHSVPCVRCGPSGKPAPAGSPLSAGHQHARALRLVAKAVLKDLWLESERLHLAAEAA